MGKSLHSDPRRERDLSAPSRVFRTRLRNGEGEIENYIRALIAGPGEQRHNGKRRGCCEKALKPASG
jgi:hypothetical protein